MDAVDGILRSADDSIDRWLQETIVRLGPHPVCIAHWELEMTQFKVDLFHCRLNYKGELAGSIRIKLDGDAFSHLFGGIS